MHQFPEFNGVEVYYFFIYATANVWVVRWKGLSIYHLWKGKSFKVSTSRTEELTAADT